MPCAVGTLIALHKWTSPARKVVAGKDAWYWSHIIVQLSAFGLITVAFAWAAIYTPVLPAYHLPPIFTAHMLLGIVAFALICLQVG